LGRHAFYCSRRTWEDNVRDWGLEAPDVVPYLFGLYGYVKELLLNGTILGMISRDID
jgi:hypothetical protein